MRAPQKHQCDCWLRVRNIIGHVPSCKYYTQKDNPMCDTCPKPTTTMRKRYVVLQQHYPNKQYPNQQTQFGIWNTEPFATQADALAAAGKGVNSTPAAILLVAEVTHEVTIGVPNVTKIATE
jgi:hypothetical protein